MTLVMVEHKASIEAFCYTKYTSNKWDESVDHWPLIPLNRVEKGANP